MHSAISAALALLAMGLIAIQRDETGHLLINGHLGLALACFVLFGLLCFELRGLFGDEA